MYVIEGGVTEFKIDENLKPCFAQMFDKIIVYGLLTDYKTGLVYPMKYDVDFTKDQNTIFVGGEVDAVKAFMGIVQIMNN